MITLIIFSGCTNELEINSAFYCEKLELNCKRESIYVTLITTKGEIGLQLFGETNPVTVANFIKNINSGIYNKKQFYKIIEYPNNKVIHSGAFISTKLIGNLNNYDAIFHKTIPLEIAMKNLSEPKYNNQIDDPFKINMIKHKFEEGTLSMVKIGKNKSSKTEFFFSLKKSEEFNGRYSVFGKVVRGYEILNKLDETDSILEIKQIN